MLLLLGESLCMRFQWFVRKITEPNHSYQRAVITKFYPEVLQVTLSLSSRCFPCPKLLHWWFKMSQYLENVERFLLATRFSHPQGIALQLVWPYFSKALLSVLALLSVSSVCFSSPGQAICQYPATEKTKGCGECFGRGSLDSTSKASGRIGWIDCKS